MVAPHALVPNNGISRKLSILFLFGTLEMLALKTPILAIAMLFTCMPFAFAQDDQNQQIEGRLGEVENMIKEERSLRSDTLHITILILHSACH